MIDEDQYKEALQVIELYEQQQRQRLVKARTCICCRTAIVSPSGTLPKVDEQEKGMWEGGAVASVAPGYGSRHDGERFYISLCDECIEKASEEGLAARISHD
ncbi:hypothetical protein [Paracnuella aquatica]|uniref:hypothetical protein n=1 Tax=Paracnuella aquatica TaxID=2268757 RepID=UPI000DEFF23F|nr:hypothetical protein [Paracnuella aquatica]RPD43495.1 hypothetical protein DRJ53_19835 [Paracnuella aquatica]